MCAIGAALSVCSAPLAASPRTVAQVISTGVGGLCVTDDPEYRVLLLCSLMNHGRHSIYIRIDDDRDLDCDRLFEVASRRFSFDRLGHSFRVTEVEAALGLARLEERETSLARRLKIVTCWTSGLSSLEQFLQLTSVRPENEHASMFFPLVIRNPAVSRESLVQYLEDHKIETRFLLPLINQPVYRRMFGNLDDKYPVAAKLNRDAFIIGCHPEVSDEDADYVVDCFHRFLSELMTYDSR